MSQPASIPVAPSTGSAPAVGRMSRTELAVVGLLFLLHVGLVFPVFFPAQADVNMWDEAGYVHSGKRLVEGEMPRYSRNPLVAAFFALTYLPVQSSPFWLLHSCGMGRMSMFALLWLAAFLVARRLSRFSPPLVFLGLVVLTPALPRLVTNGSNALFAALAGLALWQFLAFAERKQERHLWLTSLFLGLAALARNEASALFVVFLGLTIWLGRPFPNLFRTLAAAILPYALAVGGYVLLYGVVTGRFEWGVAERSYFTFEQGHSKAYRFRYPDRNEYEEGMAEAERLFGTAEENRHSVLRAIARNPQAYLARIPLLSQQAVWEAIQMYGRGLGWLVFLFAARGFLALWRRESRPILAVLILWCGYAILYVLLCFQGSHLLIPFVSVFALTAVGAVTTVDNFSRRAERYGWTAVLLAFCVVGMASWETRTLVPATAVLLLCLWLFWLGTGRMTVSTKTCLVGCLVLACVALIARGGFPQPRLRHLGKAPEDQAILFVRNHLPPDAKLACASPGRAWLAGRPQASIDRTVRSLRSAEEVRAWLRDEQVAAVYADDELRRFAPETWALLRQQLGDGLEVAFSAGDGAVQIWVPRHP